MKLILCLQFVILVVVLAVIQSPEAWSQKPLITSPLTLNPVEGYSATKLEEHAGRREVLMTQLKSDEAKKIAKTVLEFQVHEEALALLKEQQNEGELYVLLPTGCKAKADIYVERSSKENSSVKVLFFSGELDPANNRQLKIEKDGWIRIRFKPTNFDQPFRIELNVELGANKAPVAYWHYANIHPHSDDDSAYYSLLDPQGRLLFQACTNPYSRAFPRFIDVKSGLELGSPSGEITREMGKIWVSDDTVCMFSEDSSHAAVISRIHRKLDADREEFWVFSLSPLKVIQNEESFRFSDIKFAEDNKTLLFKSKGPPFIDGK